MSETMNHEPVSFRMSRRRYLAATILSSGFLSRDWLTSGSVAAAEIRSPAKQNLLVRSAEPYNAEPALDRLTNSFVTPIDQFYVRSHGSQPELDLESYRLTIDGLVERPVTLTLAELRERFPRAKTTATLTCAGNRRTDFYAEKKVPGVPWEAGAIGNAEWSGVRLADVLKFCGMKSDAKHVWFAGLDQIAVNGASVEFGGSIPLETLHGLAPNAAAHPLLADRMNEQPLLPEHGYPLRALAPGFIGARSVKWLGKITVSDQPSTNHYLARAYRVITENTPEAIAAASPIYEYVTNSAITQIVPGKSAGQFEIRGYALAAGHAGNRLKVISVKCDQWKDWKDVEIVSPIRDFCWVLWSAKLTLPAEATTIQVKATDTEGYTQPVRTPWNAHGYQYNGWQTVPLPKPTA